MTTTTATTEPKAAKAKAAKPAATETEPTEPKAPKPATSSGGRRSLADRLKADDELNQSKPSAPFMQLLNGQGRVFMSAEQAEKAEADIDLLLSSGWVQTQASLGSDTVIGYSTDHLRFVMCHRYGLFNDESGKYDQYFQVFLFTPDNALVNQLPIQLKLRGGSVANGTFYQHVLNVKEQSWIAGLFKAFNELFGNRGGSGEFQSGVIVDIKTRCELKGTGKNQSKACVFHSPQIPTAQNIDDGSMFVSFDTDPHTGDELKRRILDARAVFVQRLEERKSYAAQGKQADADRNGDGDDDYIPEDAEY